MFIRILGLNAARRMDTMLPWVPFFSKRKWHFINSPITCWDPTHLIPLSFLIDGHEAISLSCSSDSPNERVNNVEAAHSDPKDRILSDEAYPEERSHGQSLDELKARFDIGNLHHLHTHCDGEDSDATETPRLCIWRQDLISVIHIEWRLMYDKSFGWLFITRYLSHDIGRQGAFWRTKAADSLKVPRVQSLS